MDFLIGVAKSSPPPTHPHPQAHPCSFLLMLLHCNWIMALMRTGQELLFCKGIISWGMHCSDRGLPVVQSRSLWGILSLAFITSITVPTLFFKGSETLFIPVNPFQSSSMTGDFLSMPIHRVEYEKL